MFWNEIHILKYFPLSIFNKDRIINYTTILNPVENSRGSDVLQLSSLIVKFWINVKLFNDFVIISVTSTAEQVDGTHMAYMKGRLVLSAFGLTFCNKKPS